MGGRGCVIFVGNLPGDVREREIEDLFYKVALLAHPWVLGRYCSAAGCVRSMLCFNRSQIRAFLILDCLSISAFAYPVPLKCSGGSVVHIVMSLADVRGLCAQYGRIRNIDLKLPPRPPAFAFVEFDSPR